MPLHFLDSKALSSLGLFYLVRIFSREPTHTFILQSWKLSQPSSLWKSADDPGSAFGFQACPARREGGGRGGFAGSDADFPALEPLFCPPPDRSHPLPS